jgi:hypothetical protein
MATITKGILGGFSGTVGTVVGANYRGLDIIRSRPKKTDRKPTDAQLLQQKKFKLVVQFLQPLKPIQSRYFGASSGARSKVNLAASYMLDNAILVVADEPEFIFNKILITKGELAGFQNVSAVPVLGSIIDLNWEDNSLQGNAKATDIANVVCYEKTLQRFEIYEAVATRGDLTAQVTLPASFAGLNVHVWMYFNNTEQKSGCNSPYLGLIAIL